MSKRLFFFSFTMIISINGMKMPIAISIMPLSLYEKKQAICEQARVIQSRACEAKQCESLSDAIGALEAGRALFVEADANRCDILTDHRVWKNIMAAERATAEAYRVVLNIGVHKKMEVPAEFLNKIKSAQQAVNFARDSKYFLSLIDAVKMKNACVYEAITAGIESDEKIAKMLLSLSDNILNANELVSANFFCGASDISVAPKPSSR